MEVMHIIMTYANCIEAKDSLIQHADIIQVIV